jgi:hypothetical protein
MNPVVRFSSLLVHGDPAIFYDAAGTPPYRMWFSGVRYGIPFLDIFDATSTDGLTWTPNEAAPVFEHSASGAWDDGGAETPFVIRAGTELVMYYTGYPEGARTDESRHHMGRAMWNSATSSWDRGPATALAIPGEVFSVEPNVVYDSARSMYRLWFFGLVDTKLAFYVTESSNGKDGWSTPVVTIDWPTSAGGPSPCVLQRSSGALELYTSYVPISPVRGMARATSSDDGLTWDFAGPILAPSGGTTSFDSTYASAGAAFEHSDGKIRVYYTGWLKEGPNGPDEHGVGLAIEP